MSAPISRMSGVLLLLVSLSGCAQNQTLSPPPGGEQVSVTVKVPQNLAADPMRVMYRSEKCPIKRSGPDWTSYEEDGYLSTTVQPQRQGQSDVYEAMLPINGGGRCQWQLSNVTFGVTYANTMQFGPDVKAGLGGGAVIVMFDQRLPQRRSVFEPTIEVSGDALIRKDYYPLVNEQFIGRHEKLALLFGEGEIYSYYRAKNARKVAFEPLLHSDYVLYSMEPKVQSEGYSRYTYPDGSVVADGRDPSFKKLQAIRLGRR